MKQSPGPTRSLWMATATAPASSPLAGNATADVCVVGAGIAGLTTAYLLGSAGVRVIVLERSAVGAGETSRTTAHLSTALDHLYSEARRLREVSSSLGAQSHAAAIDLIETITQREHIACDFERLDGYLFVPGEASRDVLQRELAAARQAGLLDVALAPKAPLPTFDTGPCLVFPRQAQFQPLKYLYGLAVSITRLGGAIHTGAHVVEVRGGSPASVVTSDGHVVSAGAVVVATNAPIHENLSIHVKQSPYRSYVIAARVALGAVSKALYWDTADPFHYVRLYHDADRDGRHDWLIAGGEDHRTGEEDHGRDRFKALEEWTRERFPIGSVEYRWSGQVMDVSDGVALVGRDRLDQPNVYLATGDCGQGMTHGTLAGMIVADHIAGRTSPWARLYDPTRFPALSADSVRDGLNVLSHYVEWFTGGDVGSLDAIDRGDGAVIRSGAVKMAMYRDESGEICRLSAVCPHLGCIVAWNSTERSWDCPCHGSRFDARGQVINGPTTRPLSAVGQRRQ